MALTPYEDPMQSMDGENYLYPDVYFRTGKAPKSEEWEEFLRVEGLKKPEEDIYPNFLDYWMFWS
ncbi:MAG: hypothetical protein ACOX0K_05615 [Oscillospiraceae bacterium]